MRVSRSTKPARLGPGSAPECGGAGSSDRCPLLWTCRGGSQRRCLSERGPPWPLGPSAPRQGGGSSAEGAVPGLKSEAVARPGDKPAPCAVPPGDKGVLGGARPGAEGTESCRRRGVLVVPCRDDTVQESPSESSGPLRRRVEPESRARGSENHPVVRAAVAEAQLVPRVGDGAEARRLYPVSVPYDWNSVTLPGSFIPSVSQMLN